MHDFHNTARIKLVTEWLLPPLVKKFKNDLYCFMFIKTFKYDAFCIMSKAIVQKNSNSLNLQKTKHHNVTRSHVNPKIVLLSLGNCFLILEPHDA